MGSSESGLSEHNDALLRKFQGNGWEVTCSQASREEMSKILGEVAEVAKGKNASRSEVSIIRYEEDWADAVLRRSLVWRGDQGSAPLWLLKALEGREFALLQLPTPDNRWILKFAGKILEPFNYRLGGWADIHEMMVHGFILDRTALIDGSSSIADLRRPKVDLLTSTELIRPAAREYGSRKETTAYIQFSVTGTKLHGHDTQTGEGKIGPDRWRTCADDFNTQLQKRLDRVFDAINRKDPVAALTLKQATHCRNGHWVFSDSARWMTTLAEIPYDAKMVLTGKSWEIEFPDSGEPLVVPDSAAMRAIARILMCNNIPCPCALVADGPLLSEFVSRPQHRKYFEAIYRRPKIVCGDSANSEIEQAICAAMRLTPGRFYCADHVVTDNSELHTVCGLPAGRVTLSRADALEGVRDLMRKQQARIFFTAAPTPRFRSILADIEAGIEYARKHEELLGQVQSKSEECQERVQKAFYRTVEELRQRGDWTTRYDRLAGHFSDHIKGGLVFQYTGPYRWKVEGLPQTPDTLDLAADHITFKRRKIRRARAKMTSGRSPERLSLHSYSRTPSVRLSNLPTSSVSISTRG